MEPHIIGGYFGALIIGIVLGLVGGGGSTLAVPIFVYVFMIDPVLATAYSLFTVGIASAFGAFRNMQKGLVDVRTGIIFAIPALTAVYLTRRFLIPAIPGEITQIGDFVLTKDIGIMVFFAIIMLASSVSMIWEKKGKKSENGGEQETAPHKFNYPLIVVEGAVVGLLTGIVGAGGGFLIIPALVLLAKLPMKKAVGTSLMIIAFKSLIGFIGDIQNLELDWQFLGIFTGLSIVGIFLGTYFSNFIEGKQLKKGFGYFMLAMGLFVIWQELT